MRPRRLKKDGKYLYLNPAAFANDFAADLPTDDAAFLARSQIFASKEAFSAKVGDPLGRQSRADQLLLPKTAPSILKWNAKWRSEAATRSTQSRKSHPSSWFP